MPSAKESPVLPLFTKTRRPSASDSLQGNLDHDSNLSLSNDRQTSTWRQSMGGFAHIMLLRAKSSIDTMRGTSSSNDPYDEEAGLLVNGSVNHASKGGSLRHHVKERITEPHKLHRATSSLRRVMTNNSKRPTHGSLFEALPPMDSVSAELPTGPDAVTPEKKSPSANSFKRLSLGTIRKMASPTSKRSSNQSSPLAKVDRDTDRPSTPTPRRSSPIPIPQPSSPAPAIHFEIESGSLSPKTLFGITDQDSSQDDTKNAAAHTGGSLKRPLSRIMSRKRPKSASKDRSKESHSEDLPRVPVPRRASNDHWRLRNVSRKKSQQTDDLAVPARQDVGPPSPMPGTNLPLDDPFDSTSSAEKVERPLGGVWPSQRKTASILSIDGMMDDTAVDGTTLFDSSEEVCRDQDKDDVPQYDRELTARTKGDRPEPGARPLTHTELELKQDLEHIKVMLIQVRDASVPASDKQALADNNKWSPASDFSSQSHALADRLRSIETYVEKISSDVANMTVPSTADKAELELHVSPTEPRAESREIQMASPETNSASGNQSPILFASSTRESSESCQSPLMTQPLFYPSPLNEDDPSSEHGSASSAADQYLESIRGIATNGRLEVEDSGPATVKSITSPTLETLEEAHGESPLDEHLRTKQLPKLNRKRFADRNRSSSFDLLEHWRTMSQGKDEKNLTTPDEPVSGPSSSNPGRQSVNRQDSSCFIPVCPVCGSTDDHICPPVSALLAAAQHDGAVSLSDTTTVGDCEILPVRKRAAFSEISHNKRRAAPSKVSDPSSPGQQISSMWKSENYFEPLTRCPGRDHVTSPAFTVTKSRREGSCNSPAKWSSAVSKGRSTEDRKGRHASFCSDTDLDSELDDTDFLKVGGRLSTFHPLM